MSKGGLLRGVTLLSVCAVLGKLLGAIYRVPLTNVLSAEGMGLYQMVFPLYTLMLTVSSGGLPVALSKVSSSLIASGDSRGAEKVLRASIVSFSIVGLIFSLLVALLSSKIAMIQGNAMAGLAYIAIAPSVFFVAVISCFRGYFQGKKNMLPSGLSQLSEQIVKLISGLILVRLLLPYGLEYAVAGALIGVSIAEAVTLIFLLIYYYFHRKKLTKTNAKTSENISESEAVIAENLAINGGNISDEGFAISPPTLPLSATDFGEDMTAQFAKKSDKTGDKDRQKKQRLQLLKSIYKIAIPVTLGSLVMPITQVIDSVLVINLLVAIGSNSAVATSLFGLINGPVNTLINMPIVLLVSCSVALLPRLSGLAMTSHEMSSLLSRASRLIISIGLLGFLALSVFSFPLITTLYNRGLSEAEISLGSTCLALGSTSVIFVAIMQISSVALQAIGKAHLPAINLLVGGLVKVLATLILLPIFGIAGATVATVLCYLTASILDLIMMRKYVKFEHKPKEFVAVILAGVCFYFAGKIALYLTSGMSKIISLSLSGLIALVVFLAVWYIGYCVANRLNIFEALKKKK